jgi:hypothetical protein
MRDAHMSCAMPLPATPSDFDEAALAIIPAMHTMPPQRRHTQAGR